jgi:arsenate reductase-like glutaredoxin family protein
MAVLDATSKAYHDAGLAYLRLDNEQLFERLLTNQRLIRLPLVRSGNDVVVGPDEKAWRAIVAAH